MGGMVERGFTPTTRVKLTYDDLLRLPDDGQRHELIDGAHVVSASPNTRHQRVSMRLSVDLTNWLREHPVGELFAAPFDLVLSRVTVVVPDLLYVSNLRKVRALTASHATGADLVIEILSPGTRRRDSGVKLRLYEDAGVLEYWLVDPDTRGVRRYRRASEGFAAPISLSADVGDVLVTPLFPGLTLSLAALLCD